jgi:hypothetical protein
VSVSFDVATFTITRPLESTLAPGIIADTIPLSPPFAFPRFLFRKKVPLPSPPEIKQWLPLALMKLEPWQNGLCFVWEWSKKGVGVCNYLPIAIRFWDSFENIRLFPAKKLFLKIFLMWIWAYFLFFCIDDPFFSRRYSF